MCSGGILSVPGRTVTGVDGMDVVQLHLQLGGVIRVRRWRRGHPATSNCEYVTVGYLQDGPRWFVHHTGHAGRGDAWVCRDEAHAFELAAQTIAGGGWVEVPAVYDANHEPVDRHRWRKVGGDWVISR